MGSGVITLSPIQFVMEGAATLEEMTGNVEATLERGYHSILPLLGTRAGSVSICGAGPSLRYTSHELVGDVMACNSAIGYMIERGIVPTFAMLWDAAQIVADFAVPHEDVIYLVASRCHPDVFERLHGCKVLVWYAAGDHNIKEWMTERGVREPLINGGSAAVTRAMYLSFALGYRDLHLFGADSSYRGPDSHVRGASSVKEKQIEVCIGDDLNARFITTPEFAVQVEEYKSIYQLLRNLGAEVFPHGDGMLPCVHRKLLS